MKRLEQKLWKKALIAATILRIIPNIEAVAVTGSLAKGEANKNSDIDFLIVSREKRIWTVRFLSTILLQILGLRRIGNKIAGRICLNWYTTNWKYTKGWPVVIVWRRYNIPSIVISTDSAIADEWRNPFPKSKGSLHSPAKAGSVGMTSVGNKLENFLKETQIARIKKDPRTFAQGSRVKFDDDEIGFWPKKN